MSGTCKDCRYWGKPDPYSGKGDCERLSTHPVFDSPVELQAVGDGETGLVIFSSPPDFGCNQFEAKDG